MVDVCLGGDQQLDSALKSLVDSHDECRVAIVGNMVDICLGGDQQLDSALKSLVASQGECRIALLGNMVDICLGGDQQLDSALKPFQLAKVRAESPSSLRWLTSALAAERPRFILIYSNIYKDKPRHKSTLSLSPHKQGIVLRFDTEHGASFV